MVQALITKMRTRVTDEKLLIDLFGRTEHGDRFEVSVNDIEPYFYMDGEPQDDIRIIRTEPSGVDFQTGKDLIKVVTEMPHHIKELRKTYIKHWEADIQFPDKARYDNGWKGTVLIPDIHGSFSHSAITPSEPGVIKPRVCVCDIETWDKDGMSNGTNPCQPIISIGLWDSLKEKYMLITTGKIDIENVKKIFKDTYEEDIDVIYKHVDTEYQMLKVFFQYLEQVKPDIITGWYFIDFDWAYIKGRCERLNMDIDDTPFQIFDLLAGFKNLSVRARSKGKQYPKNLDFVGKELLGKGKVDHSKMWQMWEKDIDRLAAYNLGDVYLTKEIDRVKSILNHYLMVAEVAGCGLDDVFYSSKVVDATMFHWLRGTGLVLPSKGMLTSRPIKKGGTVFAASSGIQKYVGVVDNTAEYPSIIRTLNMSPETKVSADFTGDVHIAPSGVRYRKEPIGLLPRILTELILTRKSIKKKMKELVKLDPKNRETNEWRSLDNQQEAFKYQINSFYGVLGHIEKLTGKSKWRLADGDIGSDVTNIGREHVEWNALQVQKRGHTRSYGDTDSSMFRMYPEEESVDYDTLVKEIEEIVVFLNGTFDQFAAQYNCDSHCFAVEAKCIYERFFQAGAKKKYAGLRSWIEGMDVRDWPLEDRIEIVGFDIVRTNTPQLQREVQERIITMALTGKEIAEISQYLKETHKDAMDGMCDLKLGIPCGIGKTSYEGTVPIQVRAAMWSNDNLGTTFGMGDKPIYWYVKRVIDAKTDTDVAALAWGQDPKDYGFVIDYERMVARVIMSEATNHILTAIGLSWSEILSGQLNSELEEFW